MVNKQRSTELSQASTVKHKSWIKQQDTASITHFYIDYASGLYKYLKKILGAGPPDPEDVLHQVFEQVSQKVKISSVITPNAFLRRVAQNIISDELRKSIVQEKHKSNIATFVYGESSEKNNPETMYCAQEKLRIVTKALDQMPVKRRTVFIKCRVDGQSVTEVAQQLGYARPTISGELAKAMSDINKALLSGKN